MILSFAAALSIMLEPAPACRFDGEAQAWTVQALAAWSRLESERIHPQTPSTPMLVLFDERCVHRLTPDPDGEFDSGGRSYASRSEPHQGDFELPTGDRLPAVKLSFAAPLDDGGMFFVMALPSIWRGDTAERRDPEHLAMLVFMHEFSHTQQDGLAGRITELVHSGLSGEVDDDIVQKRWSDDPAYVTRYELERDLLYAAAQAGSASEARAILAEARAAMVERRTRFMGDEPRMREADDVFLTFEGAGNWAAWMWLVDPEGGGLTADEATEFVRGSRRWWTQDQGLALMLTLDRLWREWPRHAFGPDGMTADELIARALQPSRSSE
ncbi:hypothetical protein E4M02_10280 [Brevundimonas sp. S30B]|uniref:hypothetical protein n=1 Tax=unclassified Brevundimonas TaxID=2622653 RepID=UPI001072210B|nr:MULTISPECIES: hypothetical protein [unclassified Brevundimonas]QBX38202.1 hypothetical protein E4M01_10775 [Brevundimonas sp. MF30-B]TFW01662.1 hypothetical protein E4M02_10280 [Brevundimonas sp. S30B]